MEKKNFQQCFFKNLEQEELEPTKVKLEAATHLHWGMININIFYTHTNKLDQVGPYCGPGWSLIRVIGVTRVGYFVGGEELLHRCWYLLILKSLNVFKSLSSDK